MNLKDFSKLKRLMAMTGSDSDAEALGAIRAANRVLFANGLTWEMVFKRTVSVVSEVEVLDDGDGDELVDAFRAALDDARPGSFRDVLLDMQSRHDRGYPLSDRQKRVVFDAADRARNRR